MVTVLFFASLRDLVGEDERRLDIPPDTTVAGFLELLESDFPELKRFKRKFRVAMNEEFVTDDTIVKDGSELALIPPVSGGAGVHVRASVSREVLDIAKLAEEVTRPHCGAVVTFSGVVRDLTGDQVTEKLQYSAYESMASKELLAICQEAADKWPLGAAVVEHRVGELAPGELAVVVACSSPHRTEAFEAARFLIDTTKERVPLWKKEFGPDGTAWIEGDARVPSSRDI